MARSKGKPMYGPKSVNGSHYITKNAARVLRAAERRTGKSASDIIEHGILKVAATLTKAEAEAIAEGRTITV
jgi:hypothetical protein